MLERMHLKAISQRNLILRNKVDLAGLAHKNRRFLGQSVPILTSCTGDPRHSEKHKFQVKAMSFIVSCEKATRPQVLSYD